MIAKTSTDRKFYITVVYKSKPMNDFQKDKYGRCVYRRWDEHDTIVTISEWKKNLPASFTKFIGTAHCSYKDRFIKKEGRKIAFERALHELVECKLIDSRELLELLSYNFK